MQVILISKTNLGNIGDVVTVKNGYARNFLIPRKKAICYNAANYKSFEEKKKQFEAENKNNVEVANKIKDNINNKDIIVIENASDDGRLYGSVNTTVIAAKINKFLDKGQSISRSNIVLSKPIKEVGVYIIKIDLHSEVVFDLRLIVSRNQSEVQSLIKASEKGDTSPKKEAESPKEKSAKKEESLEDKEESSETGKEKDES